jgi:hypothetical protein
MPLRLAILSLQDCDCGPVVLPWLCRYRTATIEELDPDEGSEEQAEAVAHERALAWQEDALKLVRVPATVSEGLGPAGRHQQSNSALCRPPRRVAKQPG